jgi:hypothetical protein
LCSHRNEFLENVAAFAFKFIDRHGLNLHYIGICAGSVGSGTAAVKKKQRCIKNKDAGILSECDIVRRERCGDVRWVLGFKFYVLG